MHSILLVITFFVLNTSAQYGPYCPISNCQAKQTCCTMDDGNPGCCEYDHGVCCGVKNWCCPNNTMCDPVTNRCIDDQPTDTCKGCQQVVKQVLTKGCIYACQALPVPVIPLCSYLVDQLSVCMMLLNWTTQGLSPKATCQTLGLCSGGTCACGYCTRYMYGRCLSLPNHCPSVSKPRTHGVVDRNVTTCVDGQCQEGTEGCCVTCF